MFIDKIRFTYYAMFCFFLIVFFACNTVENTYDPIDITDTTDTIDSTDTTEVIDSTDWTSSNSVWLDGSIENWIGGEGKTIRLDRIHAYNKNFGKSIITSQGYFSIVPLIPPNNELTEIIFLEVYLDTSRVYVSNPFVKGVLVVLEVTNEDFSNVFGYVHEQFDSLNVEKIGVHYLYVEDSLIIKGTNEYLTTRNDTLVIDYDLHYKKGWNRRIARTLEERTDKHDSRFYDYLRVEYSTDVPDNLKWFFHETE